jgi:hypothetical protein
MNDEENINYFSVHELDMILFYIDCYFLNLEEQGGKQLQSDRNLQYKIKFLRDGLDKNE